MKRRCIKYWDKHQNFWDGDEFRNTHEYVYMREKYKPDEHSPNEIDAVRLEDFE